MEGKNHTVNKEIKCLEQHEDEEIISNEKKPQCDKSRGIGKSCLLLFVMKAEALSS